MKKSLLLEQAFEQLALFKALPKDLVADLYASAQIKELKKGEVLCRKGDPATSMYVLLRGRLQLLQINSEGRESSLGMVEPFALLGELGVVDSQARSSDIVATTISQVALLPGRETLQTLTRSSVASLAMFRHLTALVRKSSEHQALLSMPKSSQRIALALLSLARSESGGGHISRHQSGDFAPWVIDPMPKHRDLAALANTTRETVARVLSQLEKNQVVHKHEQRLLIIDPKALEQQGSGGD